MSNSLSNILIGITNAVLYIISFFLGLRIILRLFAANPATPFVAWIYSISDIFISPFRGIFSNLSTNNGVLDIVALIALIVYIFLGFLLTELFKNVSRESIRETAHSTTHYHDINDDGDLEEHHHH